MEVSPPAPQPEHQSYFNRFRNSRLAAAAAVLALAGGYFAAKEAPQAHADDAPAAAVDSLGGTSAQPSAPATKSPSAESSAATTLDAGQTNYTMTELSGESGGGWSFFGDPRVVRSGDEFYAGWIARSGFVQVAEVNADTLENKFVTLGPNLGRADDHNNPSLVVGKDGRITAYYSPHSGRILPLTGVSHMYYRTTKKPGDISKWGDIHYLHTNSAGGLGYTYPNPIDIGQGKTWLSWRGGNWQPTASVASRQGWTKAHSFIKGPHDKRPYVKYAPGPDHSVLIAYNQDNPGTRVTDLYFLQYKPGKGYYRANGQKVSGPGAVNTVGAGDMIQSRQEHGRTWIMDVAADAKGNPTVVYTAGSLRHNAFYYAHWDGKRWQKTKMVSSGFKAGSGTAPRDYAHYATAGASLDHNDLSRVYLSRAIDQKFQVEAWSLSSKEDVHSGWDTERVSPEGMNCVRPVGARGDTSKTVFMMCGSYRTWTRFYTSIYMATPNK